MSRNQSNVFSRCVAISAVILVPFISSCGQYCNDAYFFSGASITMHLPPMATVAAPETLEVCRRPLCFSTKQNDQILDDAHVARVSFDGFPELTGRLRAGEGGNRILTVSWTVHDISAKNPRDHYTVTVTDAGGRVTGSISQDVTYKPSMPNGEGCGVRWLATVSD